MKKLGTKIETVAQPIARGIDALFGTNVAGCSDCKMMRDDFDNAEHIRDYANAILDRIRKRGHYKQQTK